MKYTDNDIESIKRSNENDNEFQRLASFFNKSELPRVTLFQSALYLLIEEWDAREHATKDIIDAVECKALTEGLSNKECYNIALKTMSQSKDFKGKKDVLEWLRRKEMDASEYKKNDSLSLMQIALFHYYNSEKITPLNADRIASEYGYKSGQKLIAKYSDCQSRVNRIGQSKMTLKNLDAIEHLLIDETAIQKFKDDYKAAQKNNL